MFTLPITQTSIAESKYIDILPTAPITGNDNSSITFIINPEPGYYLHANKTKIYLKYRLMYKDGTVLKDDAVTMNALMLHTLFNTCRVQIGEKEITKTGGGPSYAYRSYFENLLNNTEKTPALANEHFIPDTADFFTDFT